MVKTRGFALEVPVSLTVLGRDDLPRRDTVLTFGVVARPGLSKTRVAEFCTELLEQRDTFSRLPALLRHTLQRDFEGLQVEADTIRPAGGGPVEVEVVCDLPLQDASEYGEAAMHEFRRRCNRAFDIIGPEFAQTGNVWFQMLAYAESDFSVPDVQTLTSVLEDFRAGYPEAVFTFLAGGFGDRRGRKLLVRVECTPRR